MNKKVLMIFTRNPVLGKVKTRLAAEIGDEAALSVYRYLLDHSRDISRGRNAAKQVWYSDHINQDDIWDNAYFEKKVQQGDDLGARMEYAFREAFDQGYDKVVIMGTDIPELKEGDIDRAFELLNDHQAVIGPAKDGGYYLLGLTQFIPELFRNKQWGSSTVLADTLADLFSCRYALLDQKNDIDYLQDLEESEVMASFLEKINSKQI